MKPERLQRLYEQRTNERLLGIVSFNQLFEQMLLISKGATTVKEVIKVLKADWNLAKKDFDIFFYGKFPSWWHDYLIERWGEFVGKTLDKDLLTMILDQDITDWDDVFCSEISFEMLLRGMECMHQDRLFNERCNLMISDLEKQIEDARYESLVTSIELEILTRMTNSKK